MTQDQLRLMAVHAHPDDESSKGAATMARYVDEGVDVLVVTCHRRRARLDPQPGDGPARDRRADGRGPQGRDGQGPGDPRRPAGVARLRRLRAARGRPAAAAARGQLRRWCRSRRAPPRWWPRSAASARTSCITYDENGGYPHPDHIMTHKISVEAFEAAGDPDRYPEAGEPWQPLKLYYHMSFGMARIEQMHEALLAAGLESPYEEWLKEWDGVDTVGDRVTTRVRCADWFPRRDAALIAHATQIDPTSRWFAVPLALRQEITPDRGLRAGPVAGGHRRCPRTTCSPASGRRSAHEPLPARRRPPHRRRREASPIALVLVLVLLVALIFLIRSMNKHLRKVPTSFDRRRTRPARRRSLPRGPLVVGRRGGCAWSPSGASWPRSGARSRPGTAGSPAAAGAAAPAPARDQRGQPLPGRLPVAQLRAALGGDHDQRVAGQPGAQPPAQPVQHVLRAAPTRPGPRPARPGSRWC